MQWRKNPRLLRSRLDYNRLGFYLFGGRCFPGVRRCKAVVSPLHTLKDQSTLVILRGRQNEADMAGRHFAPWNLSAPCEFADDLLYVQDARSHDVGNVPPMGG